MTGLAFLPAILACALAISLPTGVAARPSADVAAYRSGKLPAPLPRSTGARRYVSTRGSDRNRGTKRRPWRSIQKALRAARPGQLVLVRRGVYQGRAGVARDRGDGSGPSVLASPKGRRRAPITIRPYGGERVVIRAFISLPSARWFRMSGFVIDGAGAPPGAEGVSLGNTSGRAPEHVELSYNEIKNFRPAGHHAHGILHYSGTATALIGNRIHNIGSQRFYDHGIYLARGRRVVVANNVIWNVTGGYGLHIWGDFDDSWVINNTVYNSAASGLTIGGNAERGHPDHVVVANNILAGHSVAADQHQGYAAREYLPGIGNTVRHNLGWLNARPQPFALLLSGPRDNVTANPRFIDPSRGNFRLAAGSPAIDTGERFGLLLDARRHRRRGLPDRGALERPPVGRRKLRRR